MSKAIDVPPVILEMLISKHQVEIQQQRADERKDKQIAESYVHQEILSAFLYEALGEDWEWQFGMWKKQHKAEIAKWREEELDWMAGL